MCLRPEALTSRVPGGCSDVLARSWARAVPCALLPVGGKGPAWAREAPGGGKGLLLAHALASKTCILLKGTLGVFLPGRRCPAVTFPGERSESRVLKFAGNVQKSLLLWSYSQGSLWAWTPLPCSPSHGPWACPGNEACVRPEAGSERTLPAALSPAVPLAQSSLGLVTCRRVKVTSVLSLPLGAAKVQGPGPARVVPRLAALGWALRARPACGFEGLGSSRRPGPRRHASGL